MNQKQKPEPKKLTLKKISITKLGPEQLHAMAGGTDTAQNDCTSKADTCPVTR
jgi:hypothetical protein